jgi:hypothetical protein
LPLVVHIFDGTEVIEAGEFTEIVSGVVVVSDGRISLKPVTSQIQ